MSSSDTPKTIYLRGTFPTYGEANATAAITPGMLVNVTGPVRSLAQDGIPAQTPAVAPATTANGLAATFARENDLIGGGIDDAYAIGENVLLFTAQPGDHVFALLAAGQNVAAGAALGAGAGGTLIAAAAGDGAATPVTFPQRVIAKALTALNNTTGAPARIKVEVI